MADIYRNMTYVVSAKTADYTVKPEDMGKIFTTRGAADNVNFTLPSVAQVWSGWNCRFFNVADYNLTVTAGTAGEIVTHNDTAADSVALSTTSEKMGGGFRVVCDGTSMLVFLNTEATQSLTVV